MGHAQLYDGYDEDAYRQSDLATATVISITSTREFIGWGAGYHLELTGAGFTYGGPNGSQLTGGVVTGLDILGPYGHEVITGVQADAAALGLAYLTQTAGLGGSVIGAGDDLIEVMGTTAPSTNTDFLVRGWGGADTMLGGGSRSSLYGGDGNDILDARSGDGNYLRGEAGDDTIAGAAGFDDINGNMGNDTAAGGLGDDWVVGGKDNDKLSGDAGGDIVWGNIGADTLDGGDGADQVRGGQGDDVVSGGAGDDFVSGDRGDDTVIGGFGADLFHGSQDAGVDRVLDFHISEGDRVMLDPGTTYSLSQVGADTVLDMGGGHQMILVGVTLSALPTGAIFLG
jgi:Ca2+-binding RTX toxin-like protein